ALNTTMSTRIQGRVVEDEYFEPECYQRIFEENAVCMGPTVCFQVIGNKFMIDVNGRWLYRESQDNMLPDIIGVGLSKFYPRLIGTLKFITTYLCV
ncbi:unnamed protein product, partial [Allacma fusca]